jgi:hypothetical protein
VWGVLIALIWGLVMGGLGMLGAVLSYAKRHPGVLIHAAFEFGLDEPESAGGAENAAKP